MARLYQMPRFVKCGGRAGRGGGQDETSLAPR